MEINIPDGYIKVTDGLVQIGDLVYAQSTKRFIEVDEQLWDGLAFLDAVKVEECVCVVRKSIT